MRQTRFGLWFESQNRMRGVPKMAKDPDEATGDSPLRLSADIVAAYVSNNATTTAAIPDLIRTVHRSLANLGGAGTI